MKKFKAWIIIDNRYNTPLLTCEHPHIFWVRSVAQKFCKNKIGYDLKMKRVLISEVSNVKIRSVQK
jgi:hypothetical protein